MQNTLTPNPSQMSINKFSTFLMGHLSKEHIATLDLSYLKNSISQWWCNSDHLEPIFQLKSAFTQHILSEIYTSHLSMFSELGLASQHISGICLQGLFDIDDPKLALIIHESLSELFNLTDIPYEYEEHKTLYLKDTSLSYKNWGSGYGEITPHSDDLYE